MDHVAAGQAIKFAAGGLVADVHLIGFGRVLDVDVPGVHAAMDVDLTHHAASARGGAVGRDLVYPQYRPAPVPMLAHGHLGPFDAGPVKFPVGMQPVGVADHYHQPIADRAATIEVTAERQVFELRQPLLDLPQPVADAGGFRLAGGVAIAVDQHGRRGFAVPVGLGSLGEAGAVRLGVFEQGSNQLVFPHRVPSRHPLLSGHLRQVLDRSHFKLGRGNHGTFLRAAVLSRGSRRRRNKPWLEIFLDPDRMCPHPRGILQPPGAQRHKRFCTIEISPMMQLDGQHSRPSCSAGVGEFRVGTVPTLPRPYPGPKVPSESRPG